MESGMIEVTSFHFTWKIHDFSKKIEKPCNVICSPSFKTGNVASESQWRLLLYPYGSEAAFKDYISLHPQFIRANNHWLQTYSSGVALLDIDGNKRYMIYMDVRACTNPGVTWGWPCFIERDILMNEKDTLLVNDTLNIFCCISLNPYSAEEVYKESIMINNYETLYSTMSLSDLTIQIGAKQIRAHKSILSARSKVFSAMFKHNMKEQNYNTIDINDISYEVMHALLLFLYCGKVRNIKKLAKPLLIAADKYDIISLKMICERILFENLQVEQACDTLVVADRFNCTKLKLGTIDFIIKNIKAITPTPEFKELKISHADLLEAILRKIAEDSK